MSLPWEKEGIEAGLEKLTTDGALKAFAKVVLQRPDILSSLNGLHGVISSDPEDQKKIFNWIDETLALPGPPRIGSNQKPVAPAVDVDTIKVLVEEEPKALQPALSKSQSLLFDCTLQFSTSIYYAKEGADEEMLVDVIRLGEDNFEASCSYSTMDADGKAGRRYVATSGELVFKPGEIIKQVPVQIINSNVWSSSLEFKIVLSSPQGGCALGRYLHTCRVKVIDRNCFPSDKFAKQIKDNDYESIRMVSLLWEYFKFNYHSEPLIRARTRLQLITDQFSNFYFIIKLYIGKVVMDKLLKAWKPGDVHGCAPGGHVFFEAFVDCPEDPHSKSGKYALLCLCAVIIIIPFFLVHYFEFAKVHFKIGGTSRKVIQGNLVRKFLNYNEASRSQLSPSDLIMAMTRDTDELVHNGYMQIFPLVSSASRLVLLLLLQVLMGAVVATIPVLLYPVVLFIFLRLRNNLISQSLITQDTCQDQLVSCATQIMSYHRLIGDYLKRPDSVEAVEAKVGSFNKARVDADAININNLYACKWLSLFCIAAWFMVGGKFVLDGQSELGLFITNLSVFHDVGQAWAQLFEVMLAMQGSFPYLQKIVRLMNLPIDLEDRMMLNRRRREAGEVARVTSKHKLARGKGKSSGAVAADTIPVEIKNIKFTHQPVVIQYEHLLTKADRKKIDIPQLTRKASFDKTNRGFIYDCNMSFPQGSLVAIVGLPGDGKSTLIKLLGCQIIPSGGDVLIPPHLRVLHVSQQPTYFYDTLYSNLIYGVSKEDTEDGSPERVQAVCKKLKVSPELLEYMDPSKPDMFKVEAAWSEILSLTDRFLINLARAFIANPEFLVIHKPTVQFDNDTAANVLSCLREYTSNKGLCVDPELISMRRPRTCVITVTRRGALSAADHIFKISPKGVAAANKEDITSEMLG